METRFVSYAVALALTALSVWFIGQCLDWLIPLAFAAGVGLVLMRLHNDKRI